MQHNIPNRINKTRNVSVSCDIVPTHFHVSSCHQLLMSAISPIHRLYHESGAHSKDQPKAHINMPLSDID